MFQQSRILASIILLSTLAFSATKMLGQDDSLAALRARIKAEQGPRWVTEKTLIATSKEQYDRVIDYMIREDWEGLTQSINDGEVQYVAQGDQVQLVDPHKFYPLSQIRVAGDNRTWIIANEFLSEKLVASLDQDLKASRGDLGKANLVQKPLKGDTYQRFKFY